MVNPLLSGRHDQDHPDDGQKEHHPCELVTDTQCQKKPPIWRVEYGKNAQNDLNDDQQHGNESAGSE